MKITCQSCGAKYSIADDKIGGKAVKIKCKKCSAAILVSPEAARPPEVDELAATRMVDGAGPPSVGPADEYSVSFSDTDQRPMSALAIAEGLRNGTITPDVYVWRDGFADWKAIQEVPELMRYAPAAAPPAPPPSEAAPQVAEPALAGAGALADLGSTVAMPAEAVGPSLSKAGEPAGASRRDLFSAKPEPAAPAAPPPDAAKTKQLGERNENSVLFSIASLTGGPAKTAPTKPVAQTQVSAGRAGLDDLMGMSAGGGLPGLGGGGGLLASPALLAAPPPPPPAPVAAPPVAAPAAPPAPEKKGSPALLIGLVAAVGLLGAAVVYLLAAPGKQEVAKNDTATKIEVRETSAPTSTAAIGGAAGGATTPPTTPTTPPSAGSTPADPAGTAGTAAATGAATTAPTGALAAGDPKGTPTAPAGVTAGKPGTAPTAAPTAKPTAAPTAAPTAPAAGAGEFNKGAATAALSGAAGAAKGCKKDQSGKAVVKVTFAPSGRATSAQVVGGDLQGTPAAGCIVGAFKGLSVPPFDGSPVSVSKTVNL